MIAALSLRLLTLSAIATGVLIVSATVVVLAHASFFRRRSQRDARVLEDSRGLVLSSLAGTTDLATARALVRSLPVRLQPRLLIDLATVIRGATKETLREIARATSMLDRASRQCRLRSWSRRLFGARLLTAIGSEKETMKALLSDPSAPVRAQAAEWAAGYPDEDVIASLIPMLTDHSDLCSHTAADSLLRIGAPAARYLIAHIDSINEPMMVAGVLRIAAGVPDPDFLPFVLQASRSDDAMVRARAATALGSISSDATTLTHLLQSDPDPDVKSAAASAIGKTNDWSAAPALAASMRDPSFDVRRASAHALVRLGSPGALYLRRALSDEDPFVVDMARRTLDEQRIEREMRRS